MPSKEDILALITKRHIDELMCLRNPPLILEEVAELVVLALGKEDRPYAWKEFQRLKVSPSPFQHLS